MTLGVQGAPQMQAVAPIDISGLDLETALMAVQSQRAQLLETQLANQIEEVKIRNDKIAKLNQVLNVLNKVSAAFKSDAKSGDKIGKDAFNKLNAEYKQACEAAGVNLELSEKVDNSAKIQELKHKSQHGDPISKLIAKKNLEKAEANHNPSGAFHPNTTKGNVETAINQVKGLIDAANNSNQMDMLRLQSLTNKRNEAFDVMSNFIKKMQDSRSSIIGNMR